MSVEMQRPAIPATAYNLLIMITITASSWISTADFDNDGDEDFAGCTLGGYAAVWWKNDGDMAFAMHELDGHFDGYCLIPVDLDQDGRIDLVGAGRDDDAVIWWRNMEATGAKILVGPGPGPDNAPLVRLYPTINWPEQEAEFSAYGAPYFGVNVAVSDLDGNGVDEILTGPGPGSMYGPHVRGFAADGTPVSGVSFLAYGTPKWGVNVCSGDIDGDGYDEIITGAGPGAVFGPHVRAFDSDGGTPTPLPGFSFFAWPADQRRGGATVSSGRDLSGDGRDEILSGLGPMEENRGHVRVWRYTGSGVEQVYEILAFTGPFRYGANAAAGRF